MMDRSLANDVGAELLRRAEEMTIKLHRRADGRIDSTFEVIGSTLFKEEDSDGPPIDRAADLAFLRRLMRAFEGGAPRT